MKKQILLIASLLAVSTAAFAGCGMENETKSNPDNDNNNTVQQQNEENKENNNGGSGYGFIQPRTPRIRKDRATDENDEQIPLPPPCIPKEPHKDDGRHVTPPPPAPKPMPEPQPKN